LKDYFFKVSNLSKSYVVRSGLLRKKQSLKAVCDVSFSIESGETLGLVGESGCGKSTLGRSILRLEEPDSGSVHFQGEDVTLMKCATLRRRRRDMQIIFQDPYSSLNPRMRVRDILAEPFLIHKIIASNQVNAKVCELLNVVGLPRNALDKFPHEFSGGQRQRIGIARAVALSPKLVVADEPVSALDVSIQSQILNLLVDLREEFGLSYLFVAHDLAVVEFISDRVAVMYLGSIVELASKADLFKSPRHPYTKALLDAVPVAEVNGKKDRMILKGDVPSPINRPSGCHFHPRCPFATDLCKLETPKLRQVNASQVSCHHAEQIG